MMFFHQKCHKPNGMDILVCFSFFIFFLFLRFLALFFGNWMKVKKIMFGRERKRVQKHTAVFDKEKEGGMDEKIKGNIEQTNTKCCLKQIIVYFVNLMAVL